LFIIQEVAMLRGVSRLVRSRKVALRAFGAARISKTGAEGVVGVEPSITMESANDGPDGGLLKRLIPRAERRLRGVEMAVSDLSRCTWRVFSRFLLTGGLVGFAAASSAQTTTPDLNTIVKLGTGWGADIVGVSVNRPIINPAGCGTPDGYMSESPHLGYKAHYAALLMAFATGRQVQITVSNTVCVHGRPAIIGVSVN
jgi:hypothetical protein